MVGTGYSSQATLVPGGTVGDGQTSLIYNSDTGEVLVDAPLGGSLTSIRLDSEAGLFTGPRPDVLTDAFDSYSSARLFKISPTQPFGSISFGAIIEPRLSESLLLADLTVIGSLLGGGNLGDVDLVFLNDSTLPSLNIATFAIGEMRGVLLFWETTVRRVQLQSAPSLEGNWKNVTATAAPHDDGRTYTALTELSSSGFFRLVDESP